MEISLLTWTIVIVALVLFYKWGTKNNGYFCDKPVQFLEPTFLVGNNAPMVMKTYSLLDFVWIVYNKFPDASIFGLFDFVTPFYMLRDVEMIKKIGVKDFDHFVDHRSIFGNSDEDSDCLFVNSLISLHGEKWKDMRATLSPAFTGSKMRLMFELVSECGQNMSQHFLKEARENGAQVLEMKDIFSRFANDVIATAAFGIKVDSFKEKENPFFLMGKKMMNFNKISTFFKILLMRFFPKLMRAVKSDLIDSDVTSYFKGIITETMNTREAQGIIRPDMINLLMELKKGKLKHQIDEVEKEDGFATVKESNIGKTSPTRTWTDNQLIAQAFLFFLAGFDTTSTCLQFLAYELMVNPDVQQKLFEEVTKTNEDLEGRPLTYDALQKMKYMDMTVSEVLRLWPPVPVTDRVALNDYAYNDSNGTKLTIEKGCGIWIPIYALHHDPKYYPNPKKFDPERFSNENKHNINAGAYLPFGIGPRNCIGSRFALMEVKAIIYHLLLNFALEVNEKSQIPLKIAKSSFGIFTEKGVWIELKPRH